MASTVIRSRLLQDESDEFIRSQLAKYVPMFSEGTDRSAWDLISDLEKIIEYRLYEKLGFKSMADYSAAHLNHTAEWCNDIIRIYREESAPDATVGEVIKKADQMEQQRTDWTARLAAGKSLRKVAKDAGVSHETVRNRCQGKQSKTEKVDRPIRDSNARTIYLSKDNKDNARKIIDRVGDGSAGDIASEIMQALNGC